MKQFVVLFLCVTFFLLSVPMILAQTPCTPIFGGGLKEDDKPYCLEEMQANAAASNAATPTPIQSPGFKTPNDNMVTQNGSTGSQTKGGLYPAPTVNKQPNTGPELLGLLALPAAGLAGWKLRKKTGK